MQNAWYMLAVVIAEICVPNNTDAFCLLFPLPASTTLAYLISHSRLLK